MSAGLGLADIVQRFADGDLSMIPLLRAARTEELDRLARTSGPRVLTARRLHGLVQGLALDVGSQHNARVWAHFWKEGQFPQQAEGESPTFDNDYEAAWSPVIAEVVGVLWELGDEEEGWLDEEKRAGLLEVLQPSVADGP